MFIKYRPIALFVNFTLITAFSSFTLKYILNDAAMAHMFLVRYLIPSAVLNLLGAICMYYYAKKKGGVL
jgi:hypothetical protein